MATHDREFFVQAYEGAPPPWDIGHPQRDLLAAFDELALSGSVLDLGCGTGEHVLELARRGLDAWGVDSTPGAIAAAEKKATARDLKATFRLGDALEMAALGRTFDTVLDCGLFHVIAEEHRVHYVRELPRVLSAGGRFLMLGWATNPAGVGPRGYSAEELRAYLSDGWREEWIRPATFETLPLPWAADRRLPAWVSSFVRER